MNAEEYYTTHWRPRSVWGNLKQKRHQMRFKECVKYLNGNFFADIGCGAGHSTNRMKRLKPGKWVGFDFSKSAIEDAIKNFPDIDFFHVEDLFYLCYFENVFDAVVCSEVIEHVPNDKEFLEAIWKMTEGALVVTTPNKTVNDPGHLRLYDIQMLESLYGAIPHKILQVKWFWCIVSNKEHE